MVDAVGEAAEVFDEGVSVKTEAEALDEAEGMVLEKIKECDGPLQPEPKKKRKRTGELPGYLVVEQL